MSGPFANAREARPVSVAPLGTLSTRAAVEDSRKLADDQDSQEDDQASKSTPAPRPAPADPADLAPAFSKATPASMADLREMERHVEGLIKRVSPTLVAVTVGNDTGSGVVISEDGLVLTAGHVCERPNRNVVFTFANGKTARGKTVGVNRESDTGLMKISDPGPWPCAAVGETDPSNLGQWVLALGHPGGFDSRRSLVARLGRVVRSRPSALQSDCTITLGDSGGPLFDMFGRVIGIHSAISASFAENFHVPIAEFRRTWEELITGGKQASVSGPAAEDETARATLPRTRQKNGEQTLSAFAPVSAATRQSVVRFNVDGDPVALGAVVDADGLVLTKASEIKKGKLTCWLATEKEADAEVVATDEEEDVALVRVHAKGLRPIPWDSSEVEVGQWAITPGIADTPHSVGIISALPRRIRPMRALIGVQFGVGSSVPKIDSLLPGLGAEQAGLKPGDTILAVNGTTMTNREHVVETLREFRDGQTVRLRAQRGDEQIEADVRMIAPKPGQAGSSPGMRVSRMGGKVSQRAEGFELALEHDTALQPWLCGGPLVNLEGKAVGLNIARAGRVTTYALPSQLASRIAEELEDKASTARNGAPSGTVRPGF